MSDQCRCVMHSESDRIVWDGSDCPLHYDQEETMSEYTVADFADLRRDLALARKELADLREENDRLEQVLQSPLLMEALEVAWEAAEEATEDAPIREGDVVIVRNGGGFTVEPADRILSGQTHGRERILSRAPKREPWADLADVLADMGHLSPTGHAKALYERGVRVTGGEASE